MVFRTKPLYADWVDLGDDRARSGAQGLSMLMPPGTYTVTLEVEGQPSQSQELRVLKDPNSSGTEEDIRTQLAAFSEIRDDYAEVTSMVNRIEWVRRQLYDLQAVLEDRGEADDILSAASELDESLIAVEDNLVRLITTGTGQDGVRWAPKLAEELRYLGGNIMNGDFAPTDQVTEVQLLLNARVLEYRSRVDELFEGAVAEFNRRLLASNLSPLISDR